MAMASHVSQDVTIKCGFGSISGLEFRADIVKKGAALLAEGHMGDIKEIRSKGKVTILARCVPEASIRNTPYIITLELNPTTRKVIEAHCNCQAGATGMCKHTYSLYKAVNSERLESKTDKEQMWQKPSDANFTLYPKGESVSKIMNNKNPEKHSFKPTEKGSDILVGLFQKHGLREAALYKSLTVDKSQVVHRGQISSDSTPELDPLIKQLLALPRWALSPVCTATVSYCDELPLDLRVFYDQNVKIASEAVVHLYIQRQITY